MVPWRAEHMNEQDDWKLKRSTYYTTLLQQLLDQYTAYSRLTKKRKLLSINQLGALADFRSRLSNHFLTSACLLDEWRFKHLRICYRNGDESAVSQDNHQTTRGGHNSPVCTGSVALAASPDAATAESALVASVAAPPFLTYSRTASRVFWGYSGC